MRCLFCSPYMLSSVGSPVQVQPGLQLPNLSLDHPSASPTFDYVCVMKGLGFCRTILPSRSEVIKLMVSVYTCDFHSFLPSPTLYPSSLLNCLFCELQAPALETKIRETALTSSPTASSQIPSINLISRVNEYISHL